MSRRQSETDDRHADEDDRVGYKRPPRHSQFQRGQSGNPRGRPRKQIQKFDLAAILEDELKCPITVTENGVTTKVSKGEAIIKATIAKGIKGDTSATRLIERWLDGARAAGRAGAPRSDLAAFLESIANNGKSVTDKTDKAQSDGETPK